MGRLNCIFIPNLQGLFMFMLEGVIDILLVTMWHYNDSVKTQCLNIFLHYFIVFFKHRNQGYKFQNVLKN
jgi:hypothetical protein